VLFLSVFTDPTGERFQSPSIAARVAAAANAPVYGVYDTNFGGGLGGGHMDTFETGGTQTAALAARSLRGESPPGIGARESDSHAYLVDWRALQHWGLDEARLPPGTEIRFREPSLWQTRRTEVLLVAGFIVLQFAMIVALLVERKRRRTTQRSL